MMKMRLWSGRRRCRRMRRWQKSDGGDNGGRNLRPVVFVTVRRSAF
ncbi:hypothetical protein Hanom_Chr14g01257241 [Helianthus anomalus]